MLQQVERFEQEIVGGCGGDRAPVGLGELEIGADGGDGDAEFLGDAGQGVSLLSEMVGAHDATSAFGRDEHGWAFRLAERAFCSL